MFEPVHYEEFYVKPLTTEFRSNVDQFHISNNLYNGLTSPQTMFHCLIQPN